jgi:hypothetical protein
MKTRLLPLIAVFLLLSGCGENTDSLKEKIANQQQEIAQLKEDLEKESAGGQIRQSAVNASVVYEWAWPLRWLPAWSDASLRFGQEMRAQGWAADWRAWADLAVLYIAAAGAIGAGVGAGVAAMRRMERSKFLQDKIREQQEQLRKGQPDLERLRRIQREEEAASAALHERIREIEEAEQRLAEAQQKAYAMEQWAAELENEKSRVLEEYRSQLEREQRATQQAAEHITKALDDL